MPSISDNQASITAAFVVVGVLLAAKHQWLQQLASWAVAPVTKTQTPPSPSTGAQP